MNTAVCDDVLAAVAALNESSSYDNCSEGWYVTCNSGYDSLNPENPNLRDCQGLPQYRVPDGRYYNKSQLQSLGKCVDDVFNVILEGPFDSAADMQSWITDQGGWGMEQPPSGVWKMCFGS